MLADNFKTAADLGLPEAEYAAIITVLRMLERGEITADEFDMASCDRCICGWARKVSNCAAFRRGPGVLRDLMPPDKLAELGKLFMIGSYNNDAEKVVPAEAAIALRNYLVTGEACWSEAGCD